MLHRPFLFVLIVGVSLFSDLSRLCCVSKKPGMNLSVSHSFLKSITMHTSSLSEFLWVHLLGNTMSQGGGVYV